MSAPERIWAKTHGMSTDVISGKRGLIGGWNEHQRDGQVEFVRADIAASQLAEVRAERDEAVANAGHLLHQLEQMKAGRDRLAADNARMREALEPFAESGKAMLLTGGRNPKLSGPRLAEHLERARTAYAGKE